MRKNKADKVKQDDWVIVHRFISKVHSFKKREKLTNEKLGEMLGCSESVICESLKKEFSKNHLTMDVYELLCERMGLDVETEIPNYKAILRPTRKEVFKKQPIEEQTANECETEKTNESVEEPQRLDLFYNVEETIEETTTIAELEDSIEFIVEDLEHYIGQLQRVLYRLHKFENKGDRK